MNLRGKKATWQSLAGFGFVFRNLFRDRSVACKVMSAALQPRTRCATNCQNRYPSPSRRSDQNTLVGPTCHSWFRRSIAGFPSILRVVIAYQARKGLLKLRSNKLHNFRGKTRCKRNSHSHLSPRFLDCRPVRKAQTSSAPRLAAWRAVLLAMPLTKEAASKAVFLARQLVHWQTTSVSKLHTGRVFPTRYLTTQGCPGLTRMALFAVRASGARTRSA